MNDIVQVALISGITTALPLLATQGVNLIVSLRNNRKIDQLKEQTDGLTKALVQTTRSDALQEGHAQGVKDEKKDAANSKPGDLT
jgi:short-subunit dehydrogenase